MSAPCSWPDFEDARLRIIRPDSSYDALGDRGIFEEVLAEVLFGFDPVGFGDHGGQVEQSVFGGLKFGNDFAFFQRV